MSTQKELLYQVLNEISDLRNAVDKISACLFEIQLKEQLQRQIDFDKLNKPIILTVNEDQQCWEYGPTSISLSSNERMLINDFVHFSIRVEAPNDDNDKFKYREFIIWEFNQSETSQVQVTIFGCDKNGKENYGDCDYIYEGEIRQDMIK